MNNQIKVVQENGAYVGYLLRSGEMIFSTPPCTDAGTASRLVSEHLKLQTTTAPVPVPSSAVSAIPQTYSPSVQNTQVSPPRSRGGCGCGRG
jgi:hypothetical protein